MQRAAHSCARFGRANSRRKRKFHRVSFLGGNPSLDSRCLLVTFAYGSGLNILGDVSRYHTAVGTSTKIFTKKINTETRALKYKYQNEYRDTREHKYTYKIKCTGARPNIQPQSDPQRVWDHTLHKHAQGRLLHQRCTSHQHHHSSRVEPTMVNGASPVTVTTAHRQREPNTWWVPNSRGGSVATKPAHSKEGTGGKH